MRILVEGNWLNSSAQKTRGTPLGNCGAWFEDRDGLGRSLLGTTELVSRSDAIGDFVAADYLV